MGMGRTVSTNTINVKHTAIWIMNDIINKDVPDDKIPAILAKGTHLAGRSYVEMQGTKIDDTVYAVSSGPFGDTLKRGLLGDERRISVKDFIELKRKERLNRPPTRRELIAYIK